jgi:hypothetical protein
MALNQTETERRKVAAENLAKKVKLERQAIIALDELLREITRDLRAFATVTGESQDANAYRDELSGILSRQSRRVSRAFLGSVIDAIEELADDENDTTTILLTAIATANGLSLIELLDQMRAEIRVKVTAFNTEQVGLDTSEITGTNQKALDSSVARARAQLIEEGDITPTNAAVGALAAKIFLNANAFRSDLIATTFTQKIAEHTTNSERDVFFEKRNGMQAMGAGIPPVEEVEYWVSQGDERVRTTREGDRFDHLDADGSTSVGGIFTVSGEQLRFPGDPDLGASSGNIINCRCSAVISFTESEVSNVTARGLAGL